MAEVPPVPPAPGGITIDPQVAARAVAPSLEMRGISKGFRGVMANDGIDLSIRPGEIHALLGENGAGKSTLVKCMLGFQHADAGEYRVDGQPYAIHTPPMPNASGWAWCSSTSP